MSKAKATLSFAQIGSLLEGKPVTVRLPETLERVDGQPENVTKKMPGVEIELSREPLRRGHRVIYKVTGAEFVDLDMSFIDKVFDDFDDFFARLGKGFESIFRLPRSK